MGVSPANCIARAPAGCAHAAPPPVRPPDGIADAADADTDVLHYALDLQIFPDLTALAGTNTMSVRSLVDGLTTFRFRLDSALAIETMTCGGVEAAWTRVDNATVEVTLDRAYSADEEFALAVSYSGLPRAEWWGSIRFTTHDGQPLVYTISQPYYAHTWWPCKDDNADKATADLRFTVPAALTVASNGLLQSITDLPDGRKLFHWRTDFPTAPYLFCFAATSYNVHTRYFTHAAGEMPVEFYLYPDRDSAENREKLARCLPMLETFGQLYGPYPFLAEKYGIYHFGFSGGMEHQTMTGQGSGYTGLSEWLTAHELAHQWWGDMITCATWHDIWLNEGFATYSEALWEEFKGGSSNPAALHGWMAHRRPGNFTDTVYVDDISQPARIFDDDLSYRKGAWVLHMLRHVVGDDDFFAALALYRGRYALGSATTADFRAACEEVAARDLARFFQQWVYEPGAPAYEFAWQPVTADQRTFVELMIRQAQTADAPTFAMPVDVRLTDADGAYTHVAWNDARQEHLLFEVTTAPSTLQLDPEHWILTQPADAQTTEFESGPPKIVALRPAPAVALTPAEFSTLEIVFHTEVAVPPLAVHVEREGAGVDFAARYEAATQTLSLGAREPLTDGSYRLVVSDAIRGGASDLALDGELATADGTLLLPSGDGLPGGTAEATFVVAGAGVPGDMNGDAVVDVRDIPGFILALSRRHEYRERYPFCDILNGDVNADGSVNNADSAPFAELVLN